MAEGPVKPDLTPFRKANGGGKQPWEERLKLVRRHFPSTEGFDWKRAFDRDVDLLGRILKDVLKADLAAPGRPGPRPAVDLAEAEPRLDRWMGKNPTERPYTVMSFAEALRLLAGERSTRHLERKLGIDRCRILRLLNGFDPRAEEMERVAEAFGKSASYFLEYRQLAITAAVARFVEDAPETTVRYYEALHA